MVIVTVSVEKDDVSAILLGWQQGHAGCLGSAVACGGLPPFPRRSAQVQEELRAGWKLAAADRARVRRGGGYVHGETRVATRVAKHARAAATSKQSLKPVISEQYCTVPRPRPVQNSTRAVGPVQ